MPRFETPGPITLELELSVADVRIEAGDRADTVVEVRPANEAARDDVNAAERTRVENVPGRVLVRTPRNWRMYTPRGHGGAVEVHIELPAGSRVIAKSAMGSVRATGALGETQIKTGLGDIDVERTATARLTTGAGDVEVGHVAGAAELTTGTGEIRAGELHGPTVIKNATGDVRVGAAAARLRRGANRLWRRSRSASPTGRRPGSISGPATARCATTSIAAGPPGPGETTVEVRANSGYGDITINRAYPGAD